MKRNAWPVVSLLILTAFGGTACGKKAVLKAAKVTKTQVESTITTINSGTVDAEQQAVLGFGGTGRVTRITTRVGDHVRKGQLIAEMENTDLRTIFEDGESEFKRTQELFSTGLVSKVALDQSRKALEIARANFDKSIIKAPFDGVIAELNLEVGEMATPSGGATSPGKSPVRVVDEKPRLVKGNIDEVDLAKVRKGNKARVRILAVSQNRFGAVVTRVVPFVNTTKEQDRSAQIELKITEAEGLIPVGASADVEIVVSSKDAALAVPARTVLGVGDQKYVYVFRDGKLYKTPVKLGIGNYDRSEIISGPQEGEIVVFPSDAMELKDGARASVEVQAWP